MAMNTAIPRNVLVDEADQATEASILSGLLLVS